jgi:hypothetical protein
VTAADFAAALLIVGGTVALLAVLWPQPRRRGVEPVPPRAMRRLQQRLEDEGRQS